LALVLFAGCDDDEESWGDIADDDVLCDRECCDKSGCWADIDAALRRDAAIDASLQLDAAFDANTPPIQATSVYFVPEDHAALASDAGIGLSVWTFDRAQTHQAQLAALAGALELVRWPSQEPIGALISLDPSLPEYGRHITLTPEGALPDGDYALRLRPAPPNVRGAYYGTAVVDGLTTSRFYVGSRPTVLRLTICPKSDGSSSFSASFSEPIRASAPLLEVYDGDALKTCDALTVSEVSAEGRCSFVPSASTLHVRFGGFESLRGVPLRALDGGEPDFTFATKQPPQDCIYVPWQP
jgi:hypothetical protein